MAAVYVNHVEKMNKYFNYDILKTERNWKQVYM